MKWLNLYFDYIQPNQYKKLFQVVEEYSSSYHSYDAYYDTSEIVRKLEPKHIQVFENEFIDLVANRTLNYRLNDYPLLFKKLEEYSNSEYYKGDTKITSLIKDINDLVTKLITQKDIDNREELERKRSEIRKIIGLI
ncbi:MAG: hypothetical protein GXO80_02190 [Chlorobi bacterium]|nr:hypothetical protein [Chlorobiota bacterium]